MMHHDTLLTSPCSHQNRCEQLQSRCEQVVLVVGPSYPRAASTSFPAHILLTYTPEGLCALSLVLRTTARPLLRPARAYGDASSEVWGAEPRVRVFDEEQIMVVQA